jgi:hypothetical protein
LIDLHKSNADTPPLTLEVKKYEHATILHSQALKSRRGPLNPSHNPRKKISESASVPSIARSQKGRTTSARR